MPTPAARLTALEGSYTAPEGARFALVASRFNDFVVGHLVAGATDAFVRHGVREADLTLAWVPGAWELPLIATRLARSGKFAGVVALGAVIRGGTPHFDLVASEVAKGVAQGSLASGVPIVFGVLTTDTLEQAVERAGTKAGNKGFDAALAALELASLGRVLESAGL
ncbi:MAG: 6,7-dimethyl-8-ribityllumazine synthase [Polyangiaceae bacterium]|nr:6,7-dimethyl-8-ribityllumazine synthase [Polyangiaceae bacterium]